MSQPNRPGMFGMLRACRMAAVVAAPLLLALIGCETRVVRTNNSWIDTGVPVRPAEREKEEGLGEALFGWTDGLFGGGEEEAERSRGFNPISRQGMPTQSSGRGIAR